MLRLRFVTALFATALSSTVHAQSWEACFEAGESRLNTEGYVVTQQIAASRDRDRPWSQAVDLLSPVPRPDRLTARRMDELTLELMNLDFGGGAVQWIDETVSGVGPDCVRLVLVTGRPPNLWHPPGVYFAEGSDAIDEAGIRALRFHIPGYVAGQNVIRIDGHSDTAATVAESQRMSEQRADVVKRALIWLGVREEDIVVQAWGETRLARATPDGVSEPLNRRVEVDMRMTPGLIGRR